MDLSVFLAKDPNVHVSQRQSPWLGLHIDLKQASGLLSCTIICFTATSCLRYPLVWWKMTYELPEGQAKCYCRCWHGMKDHALPQPTTASAGMSHLRLPVGSSHQQSNVAMAAHETSNFNNTLKWHVSTRKSWHRLRPRSERRFPARSMSAHRWRC